MGSIPGSGRSPEGRHGNPLQYSCVRESHGQRSLAGCSPYGRTELDTIQIFFCLSEANLPLITSPNSGAVFYMGLNELLHSPLWFLSISAS